MLPSLLRQKTTSPSFAHDARNISCHEPERKFPISPGQAIAVIWRNSKWIAVGFSLRRPKNHRLGDSVDCRLSIRDKELLSLV